MYQLVGLWRNISKYDRCRCEYKHKCFLWWFKRAMKEYLAIITDDKLTAWGCDIFQLLGTGVTLSRTGFFFNSSCKWPQKQRSVKKKEIQ